MGILPVKRSCLIQTRDLPHNTLSLEDAALLKQDPMGSKRSKKKRDAARRAAEQAADEDDGGPAGTAQGNRGAAWGEAEHWPHYDETLVMLFQSDACTCTRKEPLSCLVGTVSVKVVSACRLSCAQQVMCMYCLSICCSCI